MEKIDRKTMKCTSTATASIAVLVPVSVNQLRILDDCLKGLDASGASDLCQVRVGLSGAKTDDEKSEAPALLAVRTCSSKFNEVQGDSGQVLYRMLRQAEEEFDGDYVLVLPATHQILDVQWFMKMVQPFTRVGDCALSIAFDVIPGNTMPPAILSTKRWVPGQVMMTKRNMLKSLLDNLHGPSCTSMDLKQTAQSLGLTAWSIPSMRLEVDKVPWLAVPNDSPKNDR